MSDISKTISCNSLGRIHRPSSTLKDSLESSLKREEYVNGIIGNKKSRFVKLRLFHLQFWIELYFWLLHYTNRWIILSNCIHVVDHNYSFSSYEYVDNNHQMILFCL